VRVVNGAGGSAIVGNDWPRPLPVTTYSEPTRRPTGLDWSKHTAPDPDPAPMVDTVAQAYANEITQHTEAEQRVERLEQTPQTRSENVKRRGPARSSRPKSTRTDRPQFETRLDVQHPEIVETIREAYLVEQVSGDIIAARLGISPNTVALIMRRHDIPRRSRGKSGGIATVERQQRLKQLGTTAGEIRTWAKANGVPVSRRGVVATETVDAWEKAHQ